MGEVLLTIAVMAGVFLLIRNIFFGGLLRAHTEEEAQFDKILAHGELGDLPDSSVAEREGKRKLTMTELLARRLGQSEMFRQDEGRTFLERLDVNLMQAGLRERYTPEQALAKALIIWTLGTTLPLAMAFAGALPKLLAVFCVVIFIAYPPMKLKAMITERQEEIKGEVPTFINQLYMILTSGLTIDRAIVRIAKTSEQDPYDSILAREFYIAQVEYTVGGKSMQEALRGISERTGTPAVENLVEALVAGLDTGAPLERILLNYSSTAKEMWRQDRRAYSNRKQPKITMCVVFTMFGGFMIMVTPLLIQVFQSLTLMNS